MESEQSHEGFLNNPLCLQTDTSTITNGKNKESDESFIDRMYSKVEILDELKTYVHSVVAEALESSPRVLDSPDRVNIKLINVLEDRISFLEEEIRNKNNLINILVNATTKSLPVTATKISQDNNRLDENFNFPKDPVKTSRSNKESSSFTHDNQIAHSLIDESISDPREIQQSLNITQRKTQRNKRRKKVTQIIGDSLIKEVKGWKLTSAEHKVVVKSFSGARTKCMKSYMIPTADMSADNIILHCGTNDVHKSEPHEIANNILNLALDLNTDKNNVIISGLVQRSDDSSANEKVLIVNNRLQNLCNERNIGFIDNSNINPKEHLNRSRLHLNIKGTLLLSQNFQQVLED